MNEQEDKLSPSCFDNCLYLAPLSDKKGKIWCARHGKYLKISLINTMGGLRCDNYRERK